MLRVGPAELEIMEQNYPGIKDQIISREELELPSCANCGSANTASVSVGLVGRSMSIAAATTRMKLISNGPSPGRYFCNDCNEFWESD